MMKLKSLGVGLLVFCTGLLLAACQSQSSNLDSVEDGGVQGQPVNNFNDELNGAELENANLDQGQSGQPTDDAAAAQEEPGGGVYSLAEVAEHATATDCWLVIEDQVYDVTAFIESQQHPGGEAILQGCGTDATAIFNQRPKDGEPHSSTARSFLPQYLIGTLGAE